MKKLSVLFAAIMVLSLTACGNSSSKATTGTTNSVSNVLEQQMNNSAPAAGEPAKPAAPSAEKAAAAPAGDVDVDLTAMSSTMVYSEVFNMMNEADKYVGKTVRMNGQFALYQAYDENNRPIPEQIYFACIIADATACCSQGLEFVLAGEHTYPEDYPELGEEISVEGVFEVYEEDGMNYVHLVDAVMG